MRKVLLHVFGSMNFSSLCVPVSRNISNIMQCILLYMHFSQHQDCSKSDCDHLLFFTYSYGLDYFCLSALMFLFHIILPLAKIILSSFLLSSIPAVLSIIFKFSKNILYSIKYITNENIQQNQILARFVQNLSQYVLLFCQ